MGSSMKLVTPQEEDRLGGGGGGGGGVDVHSATTLFLKQPAFLARFVWQQEDQIKV